MLVGSINLVSIVCIIENLLLLNQFSVIVVNITSVKDKKILCDLPKITKQIIVLFMIIFILSVKIIVCFLQIF